MSTLRHDVIWISWEEHRRTQNVSAALGVPLFELVSDRSRWLKHIGFALRTIGLLVSRRPRVLFVQNPSMVLTLIAILLKPILRFRLVVDAHNAGVYPCEPSHLRFAAIYPWYHRQATLTIVTNSVLRAIVEKNGGTACELIDPLPQFDIPESVTTHRSTSDSRALVTLICTFAADEPFENVFTAASKLESEVVVRVTGRVENHRHRFKVAPPANVIFTGFVPEDEYLQLLRESAIVIDLTTWDDCLVCGGYEAAALGVPLILSDTPANRDVFQPGVVYSCNDALSIEASLRRAISEIKQLQDESTSLQRHLNERWSTQVSDLESWLGRVATNSL